MGGTAEWLRYIEDQVIRQRYNIKGYKDDSKEFDESDNSSTDSELQPNDS